MNFQTWFNDADMPEIVNGRWVDLETGIAFADWQAPAKRTKGVRKETALEINGKAAKVGEGLAYAAKLLTGQQYAVNKFSAYPDSDNKAAYLIAGEAAVNALTALTQKSKKAEIAAAIRLNQQASRAQNAIPR